MLFIFLFIYVNIAYYDTQFFSIAVNSINLWEFGHTSQKYEYCGGTWGINSRIAISLASVMHYEIWIIEWVVSMIFINIQQ